MKKVISLALCLMMLCSLFAVNVSAAIPVQKKMTVVNLCNNDGDNQTFGNVAATAPTTAKATTVEDGTNKVFELAFNGTGAYDNGTYYILCQYRDLRSSSWSNNFELLTDVKPINNTTGIVFSIDEIGNIVHIFPSSFTTGNWSTVKILVENKVATVYVKAQGAADSAYKKLIAGKDYQIKTDGAISTTTSYYGIDTRYMDKTKCDADNFMTAKYYLDNLIVNRFDGFAVCAEGIRYTDDIAIEFDTALGSGGYEYKFASAISMPASTFSMSFDAVKTGGERPINVTFAPANSGSTYPINIWSAEQNVKYTFKAEYNYGSLSGLYRKAENSDNWETLTKGVDYSTDGVFGAWQYLKIGYLGEAYKDDAAKLAAFCGNKPAIEDVNTKWTISNFQVVGHYTILGSDALFEATVSATVDANKTKATVGVVTPTGVEKVTPIVAVYDGDVLKAVGSAEVTREGEVVIDVAHDVANPTIKLYVWETLANGKPALAEAWDITNNVK